ncbi:RNA polymerase sigma factor SigF [Nocardia puris]|uniref:RNA polymerase sigma-37 (RpsB/SigB) subunit n=1 Tax=Nocardia puris TaxID=208602 RepID=A0A366DWQ5_9NOCA|nr:RNA polymerase sigma factor SigF [Nocardia puris]MBF6209758.1 RNA polymerase sigma factor SigF [Nocardia puris]MBF6366330.1 RNA polymerase sigma factor SigF [Nocardia puris]MBF6458331.1 RNA polymerase sigma factor SigF [Nocardia puris]RBO94507.1 RNA polymerase sigma-37 (RpsB/SigB) subunit [Nocardia puris]
MNPATAHDRITPRRTAGDSYDDIEPWLDKLCALTPGTTEHTSLRESILRRCLPLADHIARRYTGRGETYDDLLQIASLGLVLAVDRFDPSRGSSFLAFAIPTLMGEIRRHFRDHTWAVRVPRRIKELQLTLGPAIETLSQRRGRAPSAYELAAELHADLTEITQALLAANAYRTNSLDTIAVDDEGANGGVAYRIASALAEVDPHFQLIDDTLAVAPLLDALPERERRVLHLRFFDNLTQSQIAEELGVSQMQISRVLSRTLTTLREQALPDR